MSEPDLGGKSLSNVSTEHVYKIRCTFAASSAVTYRAKAATIAKTGTGTWLVTLPQTYNEITDFSVGQFAAVNIVPLEYTITTDSIATAGTMVITAKETASSGAATDPGTGDKIYITLGVSRDVLNNRYVG